jgi:hypothetical protein
MRDGDRRLVFETRPGRQPVAHPRAEGPLQGGRVVGTQLGQRADSHPLQLVCGFRADARHEARRVAGEALQRLGPREDHQAGRLAELADDLRQQAVLGDADRAGEAEVLVDLGRDPPHRRLRGEQAAEVEVGLVEADHLDRLGVGPQDLHHLAGGLAVGGEVGAEVDRVGQPPPRHSRRHRGVDPGQLARLVAGGGHDGPRPRATDDDRLPLQLRPPPQLDRRIEGVHVEMGDRPGTGHTPIVGRARDAIRGRGGLRGPPCG